MNLRNNPTKEQLKALIARQDDKAAHHMLWVSVDGDVRLDEVPEDLSPIGYDNTLGDKLQFRLETLLVGNDYVGPTAANDGPWVDRLHAALLENWVNGTRGYIDTF